MTDAQLRAAVKGAATSPDAALGGEVFKQRVARTGAGKSGGYRTIIVLRVKKRAVFVYGFAKNEADNVTPAELKQLKKWRPSIST